jgi:hypothetical protein
MSLSDSTALDRSYVVSVDRCWSAGQCGVSVGVSCGGGNGGRHARSALLRVDRGGGVECIALVCFVDMRLLVVGALFDLVSSVREAAVGVALDELLGALGTA